VQIFPALGIAGDFAGIWLPHTMFALPLAIYLLHNFISNLPRDLMEAAHVGSIPIFPALGIAGEFAGIWLPHTMFALPLAIYLLHNFISNLPRDLMEAAHVDGANHFTIFRRIVLPLSIPGIASIAIFQFLWVWNDLLVALTFASGTEEVAPINSKLASLVGQYGSGYTQLSAGAFITIAIPLIVFFSLQRYFVRGLLAGSVK